MKLECMSFKARFKPAHRFQHLQSICDENYLQIGIKEFSKLEEMRVNPFAARICMVFSEDGSGKLDFQKFLNITLTFSRQTPAERKMIWIYALWDFDGDDILGEGMGRKSLLLEIHEYFEKCLDFITQFAVVILLYLRDDMLLEPMM